MPIENIPRYLAKGVALFEAIDDDLLSLKVIGIQVTDASKVSQ